MAAAVEIRAFRRLYGFLFRRQPELKHVRRQALTLVHVAQQQGRRAEDAGARQLLGCFQAQRSHHQLRPFAHRLSIVTRDLGRVGADVVDLYPGLVRVGFGGLDRKESVAHSLRRGRVLRTQGQEQGDAIDASERGGAPPKPGMNGSKTGPWTRAR